MTIPIHPQIFVPPMNDPSRARPGSPMDGQRVLQMQMQMNALMAQFSWMNQVQPQLGMQSLAPLDSLMHSFQAQSTSAAMFSMMDVVGYAAMPDFKNAGHLDVDKQAGLVTTPGGYKVSVEDGKVRIQNPDGKWTELKAEPPGRTVTSQNTITEERVLPRDPAVRESDGDVWRYQGTGSFLLPDGTKITIQEQGEGKDLHINRVDIYNGNKHVAVDSQLTESQWQTVKRDVKTVGTGAWQNTSTVPGGQVQQRQITQEVTEHQEARQKFQTTFSDVTRDGYRHDAMTDDGLGFRLAGQGEAWSHQGREVLSGAGKGKDDKTKAFQLGDAINPSFLGYRPVNVPWKVHAMHMQMASMALFQSQLSSSFPHWNNLQNMFCGCQPRPHLPAMTQLPAFGGLRSPFCGPMGGGALWGFQPMNDFSSYFQQMQGSVQGLLSVSASLDQLRAGVNVQRWGAGFAG